MFFTASSWNIDEVSKIIPVSSALSFEKVQSSLLSVDDLFLRPVLGDEMMTVAQAIFEREEQQRSDLEKTILRQLQVATLNLAFWYDFQELNLRITDQGFQRQTTDNFTSAYKYQEDALKRGFRNKGLNALDSILEILEQHTGDFPKYTHSPAYTDMRKRVVQKAKEVNEVCYIHNSQLIFRRLIPILKELEDTNLPIILGSKLNDQLKKAILENRTSEQVGDTTYEELRLRCVAYLSLKACAQLVRQTGSLTDRGLYFISVASSGENNEVREPADGEAAVRLASTMEQSAAAYSASLTSFIEYYIPDLFTGHDADVLKRDNDHKRTFWA